MRLPFDNMELNVINNVAAHSKKKNNCFFQYTTPIIIQKSICILREYPPAEVWRKQGGLPSFPYECEAVAALASLASSFLMFNYNHWDWNHCF